VRNLICAVVISTLGGIGSATAQNWPTRPLTMIVPFAAGGAFDVLGRILARKFPRYWVSRS
jgi:tripartite-type tricarboxylate transporter receptor subunit TctC